MNTLEGVKVGDKLFHDGDRPAVSTVVKVTKLHAIKIDIKERQDEGNQ